MQPPTPGARQPALSTREIEVLLAWLTCDSKQQAARRLFLSPSTINTHVARIRNKYRRAGRPAASKTALLIRALQDDICTIDQMLPTHEIEDRDATE